MAADSIDIGINALFLRDRMGGVETYVRELVPAMVSVRPKWRFRVFVSDAGKGLLQSESWADSVDLVTHPLLGRPGLRMAGEITLLGRLADSRGVDVLHSVAMTGPLWTRCKRVITLHDLIWMRHPEPEERATVLLWRMTIPPIARRAHRVIADSEATRQDAIRNLGVRPGSVTVVPAGSGRSLRAKPTTEPEVRRRLTLGSGPILLAVSATKTHKNVERLIDALLAVTRRIPQVRLVVPGNPTARQTRLRERAAALGVGDAVVFPGWVSDEDLEGLYSSAAAFVFPSLMEGFGMPVLEAMGRGLPVACSNVSAMPEVAGDAARYFDPLSTDAIAEAIIDVLTDRGLAARLSRGGRLRAERFTWEAAAERTTDVYERVLRSP